MDAGKGREWVGRDRNGKGEMGKGMRVITILLYLTFRIGYTRDKLSNLSESKN